MFGNPIEAKDNLAVRLIPELKKRFPEIDFQIIDPTESLEPPTDPWIIIDVGVGIDKVTVVEDLKELERVKGDGAHDYDVYLELTLRQKLEQLKRVKIILVPAKMEEKTAVVEVVKKISVWSI